MTSNEGPYGPSSKLEGRKKRCLAPSANSKPGLQAWPREANLADSGQQAAGSFLFLRIRGFEGLLPPWPPYTESIVETLKLGLRFPLRALGLSEGKGSRPAAETPAGFG